MSHCKHGVVGLTKASAMEYAAEVASESIRSVRAIVNTPMIERGMNDPESKARMLGRHPIGRIGDPEDVAQAVMWLLSDAASFVTGHAMSVDGGWVAR